MPPYHHYLHHTPIFPSYLLNCQNSAKHGFLSGARRSLKPQPSEAVRPAPPPSPYGGGAAARHGMARRGLAALARTRRPGFNLRPAARAAGGRPPLSGRARLRKTPLR